MKRISQREIANLLKVNVSTVSRALRGLEGVSPELRQKILSLAKERGYRPNPFAVSLRYDTTRTIGIVVPDVSFNHYAHIVKRIEAEARKEGYMCIITDSDDKYETEKNCLELLVNMHVEGIIICLSQETTDFSHIQRLRKIHVPVVLFDRDADIDISSVVINDADTARQVTENLIDSGAKRIAFLGGPNKMKQTSHLQFTYELRYSQNKSDRLTYDFSNLSDNIFAGITPEYRMWDPWLHTVNDHLDDFLDRDLSRYSEYKNYTHNARVNLRHRVEKYDYNIGFLFQPQHSNFIQDYRGIYVDTVRNVTNLTPTFDFHYKFSDQSNLWLHYRGDTRQPEMTQLPTSPTTLTLFTSLRVILDLSHSLQVRSTDTTIIT